MRDQRGFTIIELLVVITIIIALAGIGFPLIKEALSTADRVECSNNLHQMGLWIIHEAVKTGRYPAGGDTPADWGPAGSAMTADLGTLRILQCPSAKSGDTNPTQWSTYSYAYVGNLNPTYTCNCDNCGDDPGNRIWSLYWSGVDYTGDHDRSNVSTFKNMELSDNIVWNPDGVDEGEPTDQPTVPVHLDGSEYGKFHSDDKLKFRTQRALRQAPQSPEDNQSNLPLAFDIAVLKSKPSGASWPDAHMAITPANKYDHLYTNHCNGSRRDWGINILYTNQSVQWKPWEKLRFQVKAGNHYYYY
jgi:prepilin-type N-terminal cleavage/methylation domain-containing protein